MFGMRLFRSSHSGPIASQTHFTCGNEAETPLSELLADPIVLALAASDGLSACELETFITEIKAGLSDKTVLTETVESGIFSAGKEQTVTCYTLR